ADSAERGRIRKDWSMTNQIWHLARGRIANSNKAMDDLHGGASRTGSGDAYAYPGDNFNTTFRNMVGVPIFARGGKTEIFQIDEPEEYSPSFASSREEFLSKYRVIGILKAEGKHPQEMPDPKKLKEELSNFPQKEREEGYEWREEWQEEWDEWVCDVCKAIESSQDSSKLVFPDYPKFIQRDKNLKPGDSDKNLERRKRLADLMTHLCHARFTHQDLELLVLFAMQVGRIMTQRVIKYAANKEIVLSENEVGLLNIRWRDIEQLVVLQKAAEVARRKVEFHLKTLQTELDFKKHREVYENQVSELIDPRGPIRDVDSRAKEMISLFRKLVRKQLQLEYNPDFQELNICGLKLILENYGRLSERQCRVRGSASIYVHPPELGRTLCDVDMQLGVADGPEARTADKEHLAVLVSQENKIDSEAPLIQRILNPKSYRVDDLAGARVITDYLSDLDEVLDELRARKREWGIELWNIDYSISEGKEGGYRGVHLTVGVNVEPLLPNKDVEFMRRILQVKEGERLSMPVEIQLRTAYQHSWSLKTHKLAYKREQQIAQALRDSLHILSNLLYEADGLSDIVRSSIEQMLLPSDYGERLLLEYLKPRLSRYGMIQVKLGLACAKEILKERLRYNGQPMYSRSIEVCERLVYSFGVLDTDMLLLALLRDMWEYRATRSERSVKSEEEASSVEEIVYPFRARLEQTCSHLLPRYLEQLSLQERSFEASGDRMGAWLQGFPAWFWAMQRSFRDYFQQPPENQFEERLKRLNHLGVELRQHYQEGGHESLEDWLERAYVLEAAILLAELTELPDEPSRARKKRLYKEYFKVYGEIRRRLPNGPVKNKVIEQLDRDFREMAAELELAMPMELYD
ncbi:MAG: hypothetical protein ACE5PV_21700, partial [Candidatus Poribacteria bacterium]